MVGQQRGIDVVLQRDSVAKPWGFRLQGGRETQTPLTIQRVFVGSPSDGRLQRGDIIVAIDGYDVTHIYHHDAESLIQQSRSTLTLTVQRGSGSTYVDSSASDPSYYKASGSWPPSGSERDGDEEDYSNRSVAEIRQKFATPPGRSSQKPGVIHMNPQPGMPSYVPKRPTLWQKKEPVAAGLMEPGWAPHASSSRQQPPSSARQYRGPAHGGVQRGGSSPKSPPVNRVPQHLSSVSSTASQEHHEPPAWAGSLRRSGGVKPWELEEGDILARGGAPMVGRRHSPQRSTGYTPQVVTSHGGGEPVTPHNPRLQTVKYGPGSSGPTYEQHDASGAGNDSARVAHLQYNSPIGLYSRDNAREALQSQTRGKAGYGTMQITGDGRGAVKAFDPAHSDVFRMVAEEDERRGARQHAPAQSSSNSRSRQQQQQQQQQRFHDDGAQHQFADTGISDF